MRDERRDLRCRACGYGIVIAGQPPPCPLCQSSNWALARRGWVAVSANDELVNGDGGDELF